jgi:hypothetical protein
MAHRLKITDQISPKAASGGFQGGCFNWKYQASKTVKDDPIPATAKLTANASNNPRQCRRKLGKPGAIGCAGCAKPRSSEVFIVFSDFKGFP